MEVNNLHREYCVAFIDILGFKEMSKDYDKLMQNAEIINDAIDTMKSYKPKQTALFGKSKIDILQVSDSLVFVFPKDVASVLTAFQWIAILQFMLAKIGIYLRGSINSGAMYIESEQGRYFGEAWNNAVITEGNAINPRIIIEPCLANFIKDALCRMNEGVLEFYLDDDGNYVLSSYDVLTALNATGPKECEVAYLQMLDRLLFSAEISKHNKHILKKYLWIIRQAERNKQFADRAEKIKQEILAYLTQI